MERGTVKARSVLAKLGNRGYRGVAKLEGKMPGVWYQMAFVLLGKPSVDVIDIARRRSESSHLQHSCHHVYSVYMSISTTADKIAAAARELLEKEGAEAVSMRRVAGTVGITPMAIYRHYPDREALLNAVANTGFEELAASLKRRRFRGKLEARLLHMTNVYLDHALQNPRLFELMFLRKREGARVYPQDFKARLSPTANQLADLIEEGMACGELLQGDLWEVVFEMGAMSHGLIMLYLGGRMALSPDQFRSFYQRSFRRYIHGILA